MPPRENPTARQARLGAELRKLRERAGKPAREAGAFLGVDQAKISNIESGRIGVGEERIRRLAAFYACGDQDLIDALCEMVREHRGQFWWDEYRGILAPGFLDVAEMEHHAVRVRSMQAMVIPGLLQTEDYARTLFEGSVPVLPPDDMDARVEHRMRRRVVLEREDPVMFTAVIHEAALRMRFGGRDVHRRQLRHLMEAPDQLPITVRVVPFANEQFVETTHPMYYAEGVVPQLDTVQVDSLGGGHFVYAEAELQRYRTLLDNAERVSLGPAESRQLIHDIAREG